MKISGFMKKFDAYNFKEIKLKNNLRIYYSHLPYATRTVFYSAMNVGSLDGSRGMAHILEHLLIEKTEKFDNAASFDMYLENNGGSRMDLFTNYYFTSLGISINSNNFDKALTGIEQLFFKTKLTEQNLESQKKVILEEIYDKFPSQKVIQNYEENSRHIFDVQKYNFLYNLKHPYVSLGSPDDIKNMSLEALCDFYKKYYTINNFCIFVGTDKSEKEVVKHIKNIFEKYSPRKIPKSTKKQLEKVVYKNKIYEKQDVELFERKHKVSHLDFDFTFLIKGNSDDPNFVISKSCLYEKFFELVRTKNNLAYAPYVSLDQNKWYINISLGLQTSSKDIELCKQLIYQAIDETILDKDLFERIKNRQLQITAYNEAVPQIVYNAMHDKLISNHFETLDRYKKFVKKYSFKKMQNILKELKEEGSMGVIYGTAD